MLKITLVCHLSRNSIKLKGGLLYIPWPGPVPAGIYTAHLRKDVGPNIHCILFFNNWLLVKRLLYVRPDLSQMPGICTSHVYMPLCASCPGHRHLSRHSLYSQEHWNFNSHHQKLGLCSLFSFPFSYHVRQCLVCAPDMWLSNYFLTSKPDVCAYKSHGLIFQTSRPRGRPKDPPRPCVHHCTWNDEGLCLFIEGKW